MKSSKTSLQIVFLLIATLAFFGWAMAINSNIEIYTSKAYPIPGTVVRYYEASGGGYKVAHFKSKWWATESDRPSFVTNAGAWERITPVFIHNDNQDTAAITQSVSSYVEWDIASTYNGGDIASKSATCYKAKWWTQGNDPTMGGVWEVVTCPASISQTLPAAIASSPTPAAAPSPPAEITTLPSEAPSGGGGSSANPNCNGVAANVPNWDRNGVYLAGHAVRASNGKYYQAKWWTQGDDPMLEFLNPWDGPWRKLPDGCIPLSVFPVASNQTPTNLPSGVEPMPATNTEAADQNTGSTNTPVVPPVIPTTPERSSTAVSTPAPTTLPATGYAFLRTVTEEDWDWMFPLRSGKQVVDGGTRNGPGYSDVFTLDNFKKAVLVYNHWAQTNNYKQFLNEGTLKQQAQEFLVFWAKSSRETSGSWNNAPAPWIVTSTIGGESITAWKGGLYWVEEVGYSTKADGTSAAIGYVDIGSTEYPPETGRSYYGRGIIQLSWNYNYGAFSYWLYDNGLLRDVIDVRKKLLLRPDLVAGNGELSILSGVWFWMTPQGAKPSSHDVLYGNVSNISRTTQDRGLPQTNQASYTPSTATGDTTDQEVFSYRVGTIINIVNGGLECNKAALWHGGPVQRVFYYDAYAAYFNDKRSVGATRIDAAKATTGSVWQQSITDASQQTLKNTTCYNQKSYYGW